VEDIANNTFISIQMLIPGFQARSFIAFPFRICIFNVWLLPLFIQIFTHEIQYSIDTFLRIMLAVSFKGGITLTQNGFEHVGLYNA